MTASSLYIRLLQVGGLLVIVAAVAGIWAACQKSQKWTAAVWRVSDAGALVGISFGRGQHETDRLQPELLASGERTGALHMCRRLRRQLCRRSRIYLIDPS